MPVIVIDMFTHALCKDINLSEPSPSADLISISQLGQKKKMMLGIPIIIRNAPVHSILHVAWWWLLPCQATWDALREGPVEIISCYANTLFE